MRQPLSLLHVEYETGDSVGALLALISQTPIFVMVAYATLFVSRRDLATASLLTGQLLNEASNYALKHILAEPRPAGAPGFAPEHGMPSNHSQFMGFLVSAGALWALRRWRAGVIWRLAAVLGALVLATLVCASRLYLGYHDVRQVVAGAVVGVVSGIAWHAFTETALRPLFPAIANTSLARFLLVRDCSHVDNIILAEYLAAAPAKRKSAHRA
jgi:dolichyldiphosphatase